MSDLDRISRPYQKTGIDRHRQGTALPLGDIHFQFSQLIESGSIRICDFARQSRLLAPPMRLRCRRINKNEKDRHAIITQGFFGSECSICFRNYVVGSTSLRERPRNGAGK